MDTDVVVQNLTRSLTLLGVSLVAGSLAIWLAGRLCRLAGLSSGLTALAQVPTLVALLYGASLYLDVTGSVADARAISTEERIAYGGRRPGAWRRSFWARVSFFSRGGAPKIRELLRARCTDVRCPAISTVHAVLDRHYLVTRRRRRRHRVGVESASTGDTHVVDDCAEVAGGARGQAIHDRRQQARRVRGS